MNQRLQVSGYKLFLVMIDNFPDTSVFSDIISKEIADGFVF